MLRTMMRTVVIVLCALKATNSQIDFSQDLFKSSIDQLEIDENLRTQECVSQLKLLDESFRSEKSWAVDSELNDKNVANLSIYSVEFQ